MKRAVAVNRSDGARRRGVVLVIALLGMVFLASLVFYVLNLGAGVRTRVRTQHAADAAVHAGADGVKFTGIERDGSIGVSSYSCTVHPYPLWYVRPEKEVHTLAGRTHGWLVQVQADFHPETVRHTHNGTLRTSVMGSD
jgi:hypothetical protein